ncbi:hypothetical protein llap_7390 [Limosa lapponica baueri]|uniref:Uncharacterized protein n=1 Tax=Limosa lapponica baueri TaxID=1758121 RepID=A0A2I0U8L2_LIMLA|nr:hypothetical protein llap_7390 [Limosa lapponica baueri]
MSQVEEDEWYQVEVQGGSVSLVKSLPCLWESSGEGLARPVASRKTLMKSILGREGEAAAIVFIPVYNDMDKREQQMFIVNGNGAKAYVKWRIVWCWDIVVQPWAHPAPTVSLEETMFFINPELLLRNEYVAPIKVLACKNWVRSHPAIRQELVVNIQHRKALSPLGPGFCLVEKPRSSDERCSSWNRAFKMFRLGKKERQKREVNTDNREGKMEISEDSKRGMNLFCSLDAAEPPLSP